MENTDCEAIPFDRHRRAARERVQWNIPLHDDDVLWLVPGSHRRFNTERENRQLAVSEHREIDGGVQIELAAGDGIVYLTPILHWGSNYSARHRRTLHFGYRAFNNGRLTHAHVFHWLPRLAEVLPRRHASRFRRFLDLRDRECDAMERAFRAMIGRDAAAFCEALEELHSGEVGRVSCLVQLSKVARAALRGRCPASTSPVSSPAGRTAPRPGRGTPQPRWFPGSFPGGFTRPSESPD